MRVLLVEDEMLLAAQIDRYLRDEQHAVDMASDGEEGLYHGREFQYDVAIVDLGLPKLDGIDLIATLRREEVSTPVLILTARGGWRDKVAGLEAGADDYLAKPFHMEELLARLNALMRRASGYASPTLRQGGVELDTRTRSVAAHGVAVDLTAYEYRLLEYLMLNAGRVLSRADLTERLYDQDHDRDSNVVEVLVGRLRRKIDPDGTRRPIRTVRGQGYRFQAAHE